MVARLYWVVLVALALAGAGCLYSLPSARAQNSLVCGIYPTSSVVLEDGSMASTGMWTEVINTTQFTSAWNRRSSGYDGADNVLYYGELTVYNVVPPNVAYNGNALYYYDNGAIVFHPC